jgi:hypothetical protein
LQCCGAAGIPRGEPRSVPRRSPASLRKALGTSTIQLQGYTGAANDGAAIVNFLNGTATTVTPANVARRCLPDGSKEYLNKDVDRLVREWLALLGARKPGELETRIRRYDGEYRWFLIRVVPQLDADGNVVGWFATNTDIEDRKRAEKKLLEEEREHSNLRRPRRNSDLLHVYLPVEPTVRPGCALNSKWNEVYATRTNHAP